MCNLRVRFVALCALVTVLAMWPGTLPAHIGSDKEPSTEAKQTSAEAKKPAAGPFHGKLAALDKAAKTITVGKRTFQITAETKIRKGEKPATLSDAVVGENCSGYVKPTGDGKWIATTVNLGPKATANSTKANSNGPKTDKEIK